MASVPSLIGLIGLLFILLAPPLPAPLSLAVFYGPFLLRCPLTGVDLSSRAVRPDTPATGYSVLDGLMYR
jgi:hypothetical protein